MKEEINSKDSKEVIIGVHMPEGLRPPHSTINTHSMKRGFSSHMHLLTLWKNYTLPLKVWGDFQYDL
jgi:hypothetical protein